MQTASAYQPHTLPSSFPLPRNSGVPDTSIAADVPPSSGTSSEQKSGSPPSSNVSLREGEAQQSKPAEPASSTKSEQKPRRKLRARKAAIKMSPTAVEQLHKLVSQPDPRMIRVGVKNKGCSGLAYHLEYVEKPGTFDEVVEQDGVKVLIDSKALFSIIGSEMDWQEDKLNQRFIFKNPNISKFFRSGLDLGLTSNRGAMRLRRILHGLIHRHPYIHRDFMHWTAFAAWFWSHYTRITSPRIEGFLCGSTLEQPTT